MFPNAKVNKPAVRLLIISVAMLFIVLSAAICSEQK